MRAEGVEPLQEMESLQQMGFLEILRDLPALYRTYQQIKKEILHRNPEGVILIDYPGFNLRLAEGLRKGGYSGKIIQYISPKVWAWGKGRIQKMTRSLDHLLVIFPFEVPFFQKEAPTLPVTYVGNPLVELASLSSETDPRDPSLLSLFPGSRLGEVRMNFRYQLHSALELAKEHADLHIAVSVANPLVAPLIEKEVSLFPLPIELVPPEGGTALMRRSHLALATSGTVTLELALQRIPTVVVYRISLLNRLLAGCLGIHLPHYCIVNILLNQRLFPELIRTPFTPRRAARHLLPLLEEGKQRESLLIGCDRVAEELSCAHPSQRAAELVRSLVSSS